MSPNDYEELFRRVQQDELFKVKMKKNSFKPVLNLDK